MEKAGLQEWCKKELSQLAGTDLDDEIIRQARAIYAPANLLKTHWCGYIDICCQ